MLAKSSVTGMEPIVMVSARSSLLFDSSSQGKCNEAQMESQRTTFTSVIGSLAVNSLGCLVSRTIRVVVDVRLYLLAVIHHARFGPVAVR